MGGSRFPLGKTMVRCAATDSSLPSLDLHPSPPTAARLPQARWEGCDGQSAPSRRGQASVWQDVPTYLARHIDVLGSARCLIDSVDLLRFVDPQHYESLAARSTA
ncbi:MAG: hypothetical protein ACRDO9_07540, partial [Gaiellales bacterium]